MILSPVRLPIPTLRHGASSSIVQRRGSYRAGFLWRPMAMVYRSRAGVLIHAAATPFSILKRHQCGKGKSEQQETGRFRDGWTIRSCHRHTQRTTVVIKNIVVDPQLQLRCPYRDRHVGNRTDTHQERWEDDAAE